MHDDQSIALVALSLLTAAAAAAQTYPDKPIRLLVGFAAGGPADIAARAVGDRLSEAWGKPVIVENVTGAAGNVATDRVAKSAPDGYTLLAAASATIVTNPSLYAEAPVRSGEGFRADHADLSPRRTSWRCTNDVPVNSVPSSSPMRRRNPGKLSFGSAGVGTSQHLAGELFKTMAGIDLQHVPYRGIAAVMPDLLAGRLTMVFGNISAMLPLVREGKLRALAVTSPRRWPSVPELPTMIEPGFTDFDSTAWFGLMAPAGTPQPIIDKLHQRDRAHPGAAGRARALRRSRHGADRQHAGRVRRRDRGRDAAMGEGDQGRRHQGGGVGAAFSLVPVKREGVARSAAGGATLYYLRQPPPGLAASLLPPSSGRFEGRPRKDRMREPRSHSNACARASAPAGAASTSFAVSCCR